MAVDARADRAEDELLEAGQGLRHHGLGEKLGACARFDVRYVGVAALCGGLFGVLLGMAATKDAPMSKMISGLIHGAVWSAAATALVMWLHALRHAEQAAGRRRAKMLAEARKGASNPEHVYYDAEDTHDCAYRTFCCPAYGKVTSQRVIYSEPAEGAGAALAACCCARELETLDYEKIYDMSVRQHGPCDACMDSGTLVLHVSGGDLSSLKRAHRQLFGAYGRARGKCAALLQRPEPGAVVAEQPAAAPRGSGAKVVPGGEDGGSDGGGNSGEAGDAKAEADETPGGEPAPAPQGSETAPAKGDGEGGVEAAGTEAVAESKGEKAAAEKEKADAAKEDAKTAEDEDQEAGEGGEEAKKKAAKDKALAEAKAEKEEAAAKKAKLKEEAAAKKAKAKEEATAKKAKAKEEATAKKAKAKEEAAAKKAAKKAAKAATQAAADGTRYSAKELALLEHHEQALRAVLRRAEVQNAEPLPQPELRPLQEAFDSLRATALALALELQQARGAEEPAVPVLEDEGERRVGASGVGEVQVRNVRQPYRVMDEISFRLKLGAGSGQADRAES
eukprot:g6570.t1